MARKKVKKNAKRIATFGLLSISLIVITVSAIFTILLDVVEKYKEKSMLQDKLIALEEEEEELENEVSKLEDPEYLARYAREKYFFSKDGELIIRIPE